MIDVGQDNLHPLLAEAHAHGLADPATAAGDNCNLPLEVLHPLSPLLCDGLVGLCHHGRNGWPVKAVLVASAGTVSSGTATSSTLGPTAAAMGASRSRSK